MNTTASVFPRGRVVLIGAGPGDPGLLTLRGRRILGDADVVVYDRATTPLLHLARPDAERLEVGAPAEGAVAQEAISMLIADKAREGRLVARLKLGDPFLFGSGAKEALFLHEQHIPFEVVPGVPLAFGSAYAGVPITYPGGQDALILLRGHETATDAPPDVDWKAVAAIDGTMASYTNARQAAAILTTLIRQGRPSTQTAALIRRGTLPGQETITGTLAELAETLAADPDAPSGLLVVGEVAGLREYLRWFDQRPLFGTRIVVTRSREQARDLSEALESLGAQVIEAPVFRLAPPDDPEAIERAAASAGQYHWIVFLSATAVDRFLGAVTASRDLRALGGVKIATVGPSSADRAHAFGLRPDAVIPEARPEAIVEALTEHGGLANARVLIVRPDHGRDQSRDGVLAELQRRSADVTDLVAYRTMAGSPESAGAQAIYRQLLDGHINAVTFTTPMAVERFADLIGRDQAADLLNQTTVVTMGPVTAAAAVAMGVTSPRVASPYTIDGVVADLLTALTD